MNAATQVYYASFDAVFLKLPPTLRARVEAKIDEIALPPDVRAAVRKIYEKFQKIRRIRVCTWSGCAAIAGRGR